MGAVWRTIRSYLLWTYDRGTIHYDIMVTLILLFLFTSPLWIKYQDKPVEHVPHPTGVVVVPYGDRGFIYQIDAAAVTNPESDESAIREQLLRVIEPIAGEVTLLRYEAVRDNTGRVQSYKAWVQKQ